MKKVVMLIALVLLAQVIPPPGEQGAPQVVQAQTVQTYHINNGMPCMDTTEGGSEAKPYCSVKYAASIAKPGDIFLVHAGMYSSTSTTTFNKSGTVAAPITWKAVGDVTFAYDLRDEDFAPVTGLANVYRMPWPHAVSPGAIAQSKFAPILVDDPNDSKFTMVQEDGPLRLTSVSDEATLVKAEGTWLLAGGALSIHAYGDRVPSTTTTEFTSGMSGWATMAFASTLQYNVFEGFRITFPFNANGTNNRFVNLKYQGQAATLNGTNHVMENVTVAHAIARGPDWLWYDSGAGSSMVLYGSGHRLKNIEVFHSWNASVGVENATNVVIDGLKAHGSPNHCFSLNSKGLIIRNMLIYNCQEALYASQSSDMLLEHITVPGGILLQGLTAPMGKVTIRNSIFQGSFVWTGASKPEHCQWEKVSVLEHSVVSTAATVEHCADAKQYPIVDYMARCKAGTLTDCMTITNIKLVDPTQWKTVMKDGMWNKALEDTWDATLVAGSPAIDAGMNTPLTTDIAGAVRPQGSAPDAGAYEYAADKPTPVDCVVSEWGPWSPTGPMTVANWTQTVTAERKRTVTTPPANGGAACPVLTETQTLTQPCVTITVTPSLQVTCNVSVPGAPALQKK